MGLIHDYAELWLVVFEVERAAGERPTPVAVSATEQRSGRHVQLATSELGQCGPPYSAGPNALWVTYDAAPALGCHLVLGWPMPENVLDLHAEFRCMTSGLLEPGDYDLAAALAYFKQEGDGVEGLARLLEWIEPQLDLPRALLRGRYMKAVAQMETTGMPIDMVAYRRLREGWEQIQDRLIAQVDHAYGVYDGRKFNPRRWQMWANRNRIPWPRLKQGRLHLSLDTFRDMAVSYPAVRPMKELCATLARFKHFGLAVGADGRNRTPLRPFCSKTGRNQPSTSQFIFGPAAWLRGLIKPEEGMAIAYVDFEQQEFALAGALSGDTAMMEAYRSGDPYLTFAKQARAVPADASKASHREEREKFKACALGVQYGMGARALAVRLGVTQDEAQELIDLHKATYQTYWRWSAAVGRQARRDGKLTATFGWTLHVVAGSNPRSVRNFPLQANGAEMLRLACCLLTEAGVRVCAPVHDALLIEAPTDSIDQAVEMCQEMMEQASELVLPGFPLRTEAKVVRYPERYMDERGRTMWQTVFELLDGGELARCA